MASQVSRLPDGDIPFHSCLLDHRLSQVKPLVDPATGQKQLEETDVVRKFRSMGISDQELVDRSTYVRKALQNRARESSATRTTCMPAREHPHSLVAILLPTTTAGRYY